MKKCLLATCAGFTLIALGKDAPIERSAPIDSELLHIIDGRLIGTVEIGQMLQHRGIVREIQFGKKDGSSFTGIYTFQHNQHSVRTLAMLEAQYTKERNEVQKRLLDQGHGPAHEAWKKSEKQYTEQMAALKAILKTARDDFNKKSRPFTKHAQGSKAQMTDLIARCCKKHNRGDSLLLNWSKAKDGEEETSFNKDVTSFQIFDLFCSDLIMFLEDMVRSCPKAYAQFMTDAKRDKIKSILNTLMHDDAIRDKAFPQLKEDKLKQAFSNTHEKTLLELALHDITPGLIKEHLLQVIETEKRTVSQQALTKTTDLLTEVIHEEQAKQIVHTLEVDQRLAELAATLANHDALEDEKVCQTVRNKLRSLVQAALKEA